MVSPQKKLVQNVIKLLAYVKRNLRRLVPCAEKNRVYELPDSINVPFRPRGDNPPWVPVTTDDGYNVRVNSTQISEDVHELACYVGMPVGENGSLELSFVLEIGLTPEAAWVDIEEVNFGYDRD